MINETLVMIPGPTPVVNEIRAEMARPVQAFGDPRFVADYKSLIDELGALFNCSGQAFPLAGTGTMAMEMAIANTTKRGDSVLIVSNGFFGDRFTEICRRKGLDVDVLSAEWGTVVSTEEIDLRLSQKNYAAMTVTHVDTSTAVAAPIAEIGKMMNGHQDTVFIVDGVAATAGEYEDVDGMNIDVLFTGSQKAFGVCPGMFILWAGKKALARRRSLGCIPEYYIDFEKWLPIMENPGKYFATPAINLVWALKEATSIINTEGVMARAARHRKNAQAVREALSSIGLSILAEPEHRADTLTVAIYPPNVDDAQFRAAMLDNGVVVAGSLGAYAGKSFRVGHMGNITANDMVVMLSAVERSLILCGADVKPGRAVGTYLKALN